ncbi:MAG: protoporphyrinogen oxidase [Planctomycetota bacterium]
MEPPPDDRRPPRVAILGGGITGLAAALQLHDAEEPIDWTLFEAAPRLGGVLETAERDGYRIELSADNFLTRDPWATDLCKRVGLADELLPTDPKRRRALVVHRGQIRRVPEGFVLMAPKKAWPILASPILSPAGKARLMAEPLIPRRRDMADESVAAFSRRRLGRETFDRLIQPLVSGIYTADPDRLSMAATMPQFVADEREHGSLLRASLFSGKAGAAASRSESGARYGMFVAPRFGLQQLVDAVAAALPAERLRLNTLVESVQRTAEDVWRIVDGEFDELIVTLPTRPASRVLRGVAPVLASSLAGIDYAGCSVVCLGVKAAQIERPVEGFGFVVPTIEKRPLIAASFASYKFPGRAPDSSVMIRAFVGGALQPELADRDDADLVELVRAELGNLVGLRGAPEFTRVVRWPERMPQYHVGHLDRVAEIEALASEAGIELAGAAYRGVGVPQCIHSGEQAADRVLQRCGRPS